VLLIGAVALFIFSAQTVFKISQEKKEHRKKFNCGIGRNDGFRSVWLGEHSELHVSGLGVGVEGPRGEVTASNIALAALS